MLLLAAVLALQSADSATVGAVATPLERGLHIGNTDLGLLVTVSTAVGAVAALPVGVLVDRTRRTRLLAVSILIWCAAMVVSGFAASFAMLLVTRLALGAVVATAAPAVASLTGDYFPAGDRGRIYGFILSGELIGAGFGFLISGNVAAAASWRASFVVLAVPGLVLAVLIARFLPEPARGGQSQLAVGASHIVPVETIDDPAVATTAAGARPGLPAAKIGTAPSDADGEAARGNVVGDRVAEGVTSAGIAPHADRVLHTDTEHMRLGDAVRYVLSIRTNVVLIVASALGYFYFTGLQTFATEFLRGRFSLGQSAGSTLLVVIGAGAVIGVLISGRVADRLIGGGWISARPVVTAVAFLAAATLFLAGLLTTAILVAIPLLFFAAAALGGTNPPLDAARLDIMQHHLWGRAEAVRTVFRSVFEAAAPLAFGQGHVRVVLDLGLTSFMGRSGWGSWPRGRPAWHPGGAGWSCARRR
ncbi:MAG: MFS transporter [Acidimicrobiales bacterium]